MPTPDTSNANVARWFNQMEAERDQSGKPFKFHLLTAIDAKRWTRFVEIALADALEQTNVSNTALLGALTEAANALRPFAHFWAQWNRQPMRGMADTFYAIHTGTEYAAELSRTDCERAAQALATLTELAPSDD